MTELTTQTLPATFAALATGSTMTLATIELAARCSSNPRWRRTLWQVAVATVLLLGFGAASGFGTASASWLWKHLFPPPAVIAFPAPPVQPTSTGKLVGNEPEPGGDIERGLDGSTGPATVDPAPPSSASAPGQSAFHEPQGGGTTIVADPLVKSPLVADAPAPRNLANAPTTIPPLPLAGAGEPAGRLAGRLWHFFGAIWALGTALLLARLVVARCLLAFGCRGSVAAAADTVEQALLLARRLGMRRKPLLRVHARFATPMAFGVLRPTIGLPARFAEDYAPGEQSAVLAHELAHLANRDPLWQQLAELAAALVWWQPLLWSCRRNLREASEACADEAAAIVDHGRELLAECLVRLGRQLTGPQARRWRAAFGMAFRSGLGQRVERLLHSPRPWQPPARWRGRILQFTGVTALALFATLLSTFWFPGTLAQGESFMVTMHHSWRQSLGAALLSAVVGAAAPAAPPEPTSGDTTAAPAPILLAQAAPRSAVAGVPEPGRGASTATADQPAATPRSADRALQAGSSDESNSADAAPSSDLADDPTATLRESLQRQRSLVERLIAVQDRLRAQVGDERALLEQYRKLPQTQANLGQKAFSNAVDFGGRKLQDQMVRLRAELKTIEAELAKLADEMAELEAARDRGRNVARRPAGPKEGSAEGYGVAGAKRPAGQAPALPRTVRETQKVQRAPSTQLPIVNAPFGAASAPRTRAGQTSSMMAAGAGGMEEMGGMAGMMSGAYPSKPALEVAILRIQHADPQTVYKVVEEMAGLDKRRFGSGFSAYQAPSSPVLALHLPSRSIVVRATPDTVRVVKELVSLMDAPVGTKPTPRSQHVYALSLKHADAQEVLALLKSLNLDNGIGCDVRTNTLLILEGGIPKAEIEAIVKALDESTPPERSEPLQK